MKVLRDSFTRQSAQAAEVQELREEMASTFAAVAQQDTTLRNALRKATRRQDAVEAMQTTLAAKLKAHEPFIQHVALTEDAAELERAEVAATEAFIASKAQYTDYRNYLQVMLLGTSIRLRGCGLLT